MVNPVAHLMAFVMVQCASRLALKCKHECSTVKQCGHLHMQALTGENIYIYAPLTGPREEPKEEPMRHITRGTMEKLDEVKNICSARQVLHQTHKFLEKVRAPIKVRQRWLTQ